MTTSGLERVGFVGLGNMGGPMCTNLVRAGYEVMAFDLDPRALAAQVDAGATKATSAVECAAQADLFMTSLPRPDHVIAVMREGGALKAL